MSSRSGDPEVAQGDDLRRPESSPFAGQAAGRFAAVLAVAAGGVVGGCARHGIAVLLPADSGGFPWATFAANVAGSYSLALLLVLTVDLWTPRRHVRPFAAVGLLGSFTTFSTWMVEFDQLLVAGAPAVAAGYLGASVLAGVAATGLGLVMGRGLAKRRNRATSTRGR
jgi:fluoride exporter